MPTFTIALLQMTGFDEDQERNLDTGLEYCRLASGMGADLALFPEMWNIAYPTTKMEGQEQQNRFLEQAIPRGDEFLEHHRRLAAELRMGIGATYLESTAGPPRNSLVVFGKDGEVVLNYSKVHTCDFVVREALCAPGDSFPVGEFGVDPATNVRLGAMICHDREFPESARILMLKGAEIVLTPNACDLDDLRIDQFKTRAFENAMGMAMTNYASPKENGNSVAFDADGSLVVRAGQREGIYLAKFDLEKLREYRNSTIWGNAFRRPHRYGLVTSSEVDAPFVRHNVFDERFNRASR